ncbi:MAG: succinate--CoA ligase [Epsilonproteobacteria bacterium]|nr:MAG: succinate--CoA ligase [Campylobacterota bacterium]
MTTSYTLAHSPDADDIFMYFAIKFGWISTGNIKFENIAKDIESLNNAALESLYDICAISFALYPNVRYEYAMLKTAVSFGYGYGPKLMKQETKKLHTNFKCALSGENTTNAMLFKIKYPQAKIIYMNFLDIEKAIISGDVDAGVLIHESILTYDNSLVVECELYDIWVELSKDSLPLPLGGMCIRRSIPLNKAILCEEYLTLAVKVANKNQKLLSDMLLDRKLVRVDCETLQKYLELYANHDSISLDQTQQNAINKLFQIGYDLKFYDKQIRCQDYFVPTQYKTLRDK